MTAIIEETTEVPVFPPPRPRARYKPLWRHISEAVCWLLGVAVLALWFRSGAVYDIGHSLPNALGAIGSLLGMIAAYILLLQLLFMARIPFFERGIGRDRIVEFHRKLGFAVFWMILAHVLLVAIGYINLRRYRPGHHPLIQFGHLIADFPFADIAVLGTLILIGAVILLSLKRLRKKLRYELWHVWHLASYLGVLLIIPHQLWSGGSFITSPAARVFWLLLWAAVLIALLYYRVLRPFLRSRYHDLRVVSAEPDGTRGVKVQIAGRELHRLKARGGQFFIWRFLDGETGWWQGHPFSLSMPPHSNGYQICVRVVGDGTERIKKLKPGTRVIAEGPYGRINGDLRVGNTLLMFAAGAGLGPMLSILGEQQWEPGEAILVTRDNTAEEGMMLEEIQHLVNTRGLRWVRLIGHMPKTGSKWYPAENEDDPGHDGAEVIRGWLAELEAAEVGEHHSQAHGTDVFMCGPPPWMDAVKEDLAKAGVPADQIHIEEFAF